MSFLGFLGKTILGGVTGFVTGGPAGAVAGAGLAAFGGKQQAGSAGGGVTSAAALPRTFIGQPLTTSPLKLGPFGGTGPGTGPVAAPSAGVPSCACSHSTRMVPYAAPGMTPQPLNQACLRGYHMNKSKYYVCTGDGSTAVAVPKGTACVKTRRMNVGNARALRRALRRAYGFEKLAMRTIKLIHPRKRGSFGGFKRSRKR